MTNNGQTTARIITDGELEADARAAKALLDEYENWMTRAQSFIRKTGNQPQEPLNFCRNVLTTFAMKKLESKIVTLS